METSANHISKYLKTNRDLANFINVPLKILTYVIYVKKIDNCYTTFTIPKKGGQERIINAPDNQLKDIQTRLASSLSKHQIKVRKENNISLKLSHGFEKERSIITNAKMHRNKRYVLNIDLENFFDCFHFGRVRGYFEKNTNYLLSREIATKIAQLTCYKGCLPQGAPTSPIITNMICQIFDMQVLKVAKKYKLIYTRYADDLTFSTNEKSFPDNRASFIADLEEVVISAGFVINKNKTRLQYGDSQQKVTGLIVNKKLNVDRDYYKKTCAMADKLYKTGEFNIQNKKGEISQLEGRFAFINQVVQYNNSNATEEKEKLLNKKLKKGNYHLERIINYTGREKQYQKLLFYKYFYGNEKPIILTEGKTDILYLKAALKELYNNYPNLIVKNCNGNFDYKVSFINRSHKLEYFLGLDKFGADTMKNIYEMYNNCNYSKFKAGKSDKYHLYEYFNEKNKSLPKQPVFLVYDNEIKKKDKNSNNDKPLYKFANQLKLDEAKKSKLQETLILKIFERSNLFLATYPMPPNGETAEIEDMFTKETLNTIIENKTFDRKDGSRNNPNHYGKDEFSKYIYAKRNNIDFTGFKPFLDAINSVIVDYVTNNQ